MICNKTPRNNDLTSECYEAFWSELKTQLLLSCKKKFFLSGELSISQKQAVIKLIEKTGGQYLYLTLLENLFLKLLKK